MFSHNENELMAWGEKLGALLQKQDVLILTGDLGAGKTTFTKGVAHGLGEDPDSIDLDDFLFGEGVTVIEWGELLEDSLPSDYLKLTILRKNDGRELVFDAKGHRAENLLEELFNG